MPAGCDFICKNEECEHKDKGFSLTGAWPIGEIDKVIKASNIRKLEDFKEGLTKLKEQGREFARITLPNVDDIPIVGFRVQRWCDKCHCIWEYDVMVQDSEDDADETVKKGNVPVDCPKCSSKLIDFNDVVEDSIVCPHCKEPMNQSRWYSNEYENEKENKNKVKSDGE
jgi:hypothetical protein